MKIKTLLFAPLAALSLMFAACEPDNKGNDPLKTSDGDVPVDFIEIVDKVTSSMLAVGDVRQLSVDVIPQKAVGNTVVWTSSNTAAADIDRTGLVTGKANGITIISAKSGGMSATYTMTVHEFTDVDVLDQIVDPVFKAYCEFKLANDEDTNNDGEIEGNNEIKWDTNEDGVLSTLEAAQVTRIYLVNKSVNTLAGAEYFIGLTELHVNVNNLTELDLAPFPELSYLVCNHNKITELDFSNNPKLGSIFCNNNLLTSIDVSMLPELRVLGCGNNTLSEIDVANNTKLEQLRCEASSLTEVDITNNPALKQLYCFGNSLTELNITNNPALGELQCQTNGITELDVTTSPALTTLYCFSNELSVLDLSHNPELLRLGCENNRLATLDVSNNSKLDRLFCNGNLLTGIDISHLRNTMVQFHCNDNPGDGTSKFPVKAWFDNTSIPKPTMTDPRPVDYTSGSWTYEGTTIAVEYQKQ